MMTADDVILDTIDECGEWIEMCPEDQRWTFLCRVIAGKLISEQEHNIYLRRVVDARAK